MSGRRVAVLGGGVLGVATAHQLRQAGADVVLVTEADEIVQDAVHPMLAEFNLRRFGPGREPR